MKSFKSFTEGFVVKYNNPGHEKHGREKHFDNKMSADKHVARGNKVDKVGGKYTVHKTNDKGHTVEATMADKAGPGKGKDMRDMSKLDHAKARDYHQYKIKSKGDYHSKMAKIHHANAIGGSSMMHKENVEEGKASSAKHKKILQTIGSAQNMDQAIKMVMKSHNADEKKAKSLVHKAVRHAFYGESVENFKEGYIGAKGEKGRDYHNAGTFDKDTAYGHAKTHNGVVHKDPSGKYLVKHGRGKNVQELSTDKLKQYTSKAFPDATNAARAADRGDPDAASRQDKRNRGLRRALKKIKKNES